LVWFGWIGALAWFSLDGLMACLGLVCMDDGWMAWFGLDGWMFWPGLVWMDG
jgi:hypothetical protein